MSKIKKLIFNPCLYFRDYFEKRCPKKYSELKLSLKEIQVCNIYKKSIKNNIKCNDDIDVVFTWVHGNDKEWLNKKNAYAKDILNKEDGACFDSCIDERFEFNNEIKYSVLSVQKNIPWVRNIFIVTDNQIPELYSYDKVTIVDHLDIIEKDYLPTFNSNVIEANLYKIKGLSENFLYLNDDVFVLKRLEKDYFFRANGIASIFVSKRKLSTQKINGGYSAYYHTIKNSTELLQKIYNIHLDNLPLLSHTYFPLKKTFFKNFVEENSIILSSLYKNKFRTKNDYNIATYIVPWAMYFSGLAVEDEDICFFANIKNTNGKNTLEYLASNINNDELLPCSLCMNDSKCKREIPGYRDNFIKTMNMIFNTEKKSPCEDV